MLRTLPEVTLHVIQQCEYGAKAVKPTGLLSLRIHSFWRSMERWRSPTPQEEIQPKIGRYRDGTFRTSELKEYPTGLSWSLAQCIVDSLRTTLRLGQLRTNPPLDDSLRAWCDDAISAASIIRVDAPCLTTKRSSCAGSAFDFGCG